MRNIMKIRFVLFVVLLGFLSVNAQSADEKQLSDTQATAETKALFKNLDILGQNHKILFGQQDATNMGHIWVDPTNSRSDLKDITGSFPAIVGADFSGLASNNAEAVEKAKASLLQTTQAAYRRGGITTICWHMANPADGGSYNYRPGGIEPVKEMVKGGKYNKQYNKWLDHVADFASKAKGRNGELIPILFRPFHEFDGGWFWWGNTHCTPEEFINVWRYTVSYLKDTKGVHNFIYVFSPDCRFDTKEKYLERYPGDAYVDVVGFDDYWDFRPDGENNPTLALNKSRIVTEVAKEHGKIAAMTETGLETVSNPEWYSKVLLPILKDEKVQFSYAVIWRNSNYDPNHYYAPFPGHPGETDFLKFYNDDYIVFEDDMPNVYVAEQKGNIQLAPMLTDNMIVQQLDSVRLWGEAEPESTINVTPSWGGFSTTKVNSDGRWELKIKTPSASYEKYSITFRNGTQKKALHNVLVGEVWFVSGQSNMEMPIRGFDGCPVIGANEVIANAGKYKYIHFSTIKTVPGKLKPEEYVVGGDWQVSSPENTPEFSATAYYFAMKMSDVLNVPIGIVNCSWGGTRVEAWLTEEILKGYSNVNLAEAGSTRGIVYLQPMIAYNSMFKPASKYTVKGILWYQGESNVGHPDYAQRLATMVELWRKDFGRELPFYIAEITPYQYGNGDQGAFLREQQYKASKLIPKSGFVSTNDLVLDYEARQIHPYLKDGVGKRLAYLALNDTYGKTTIAAKGPEYQSMRLNGKYIVITFDNARDGFSRSTGIEGFEIAGEDKVFYPATATTRGAMVSVSSDKVPNPVAVRYCFRNFQVGNLFGLRGLPIVPFRTDEW
jgi:sialate O-acetylesterase